jgi:7,8-dihydropterin-6-yl-methyl-4-(beta-D-ribofuranosyl)aminobenzene 5'-phosphate synthase
VNELVHVLLLIGLLLSLGTACSLNTASPQGVSSVDSTQVVNGVSATASFPAIPSTEVVFTPAPTKSPTWATKTGQEALKTLMPVPEMLTITIVYDNNGYDERLKPAWGFSALVEYHDHTLLFDTGGDGPTLLENMRILGIDPTQIESVVLSHAHGDHSGGLIALLEAGARPMVYLLASFPASFERQVEQFTSVVKVSPGQSIAEGLFTTGEMGQNIPEQALVIKTESGLVVITGCAHPGIVSIVEQARQMFGEPVRLVLGGFHLGDKSKAEIDMILTEFRRLGVQQVAPCHCTGERAIAMFAAEYGKDFLPSGVGRVFEFDTAVGLKTGTTRESICIVSGERLWP